MTAPLMAARTSAHQVTVNTSVADITSTLSDLLTRDLTTYLVNVGDPGTVSRWITTAAHPRPQSEQKLRVAYEIVQLLCSVDSSDQTIRAWFIGLNPHLDDTPPVEAIREGQLKETLAAARAFIAGTY